MKILKRAAALLLIAAFAVGAAACGFSSIVKNAAKGLSKYSINAVFNDTDYTLTGRQRLDYVNNYEVPLQSLSLSLPPAAFREGAKYRPASDDDLSSVYPDGVSYGGIEISNLTVGGKAAAVNIAGGDENILSVPFSSALYPTAKTTIEFEFKITVPKARHRFGYTDNSINLGNWYPVACRYENGAFLEYPYYSNGDPFYSDCANYEVTLTLPAEYKVAASGGEASVKTEGASAIRTYKAEAVRDFAFVLSRHFGVLTQKAGNTSVSYYYHNDEAAENSLQAAVDSVNTFNSLFGEYPYAHYSVAQSGFYHGGMEYPGLVIISDEIDGAQYHETIVHETAHQWWYAVIGSNQVEEAWLDEGLTAYSTTLFYEKNEQYGETRNERIAKSLDTYVQFATVFEMLSKNLDTRMTRSLNDFGTAEYVLMTYIKGEIMFDALRRNIGDDAFFKGLKSYYKDNMFKITTESHLTGAFEKAAGKELSGFISSWTDGKVVIYAQ